LIHYTRINHSPCGLSVWLVYTDPKLTRHIFISQATPRSATRAVAALSFCKRNFLSTHADRQGVDISVTVCLFFCVYECLFVCTVIDFSSEDKASGVKFCTVVHAASWAGNLPCWGTLLPQKPKIGRIGHPPRSKVQGGKTYRNRVPIKFARRVDVESACVDIRPSPKTDVLVTYLFTTHIVNSSLGAEPPQRIVTPVMRVVECIRQYRACPGERDRMYRRQ